MPMPIDSSKPQILVQGPNSPISADYDTPKLPKIGKPH